MKTDLNEFISRFRDAEYPMFIEYCPRIYCKDGKLSLSVQASEFHYCCPRDDYGPYTEVEVGFPSLKPPRDFDPYMQGLGDVDPTETVYEYVPIELVEKWIDEHGGIDWDKIPDPKDRKLPVIERLNYKIGAE